MCGRKKCFTSPDMQLMRFLSQLLFSTTRVINIDWLSFVTLLELKETNPYTQLTMHYAVIAALVIATRNSIVWL